MFAVMPVNAGINYVDRGDAAAPDFSTGVFTKDNTWYDLDLSSIVPAGVRLVFLRITLQKANNVVWLYLKEKGIVNNINVFSCYTQGGTAAWVCSIQQSCNSDRVIQYRLSNTTIDVVEINVRGWWI